jgi:KEOPS complex subunit Cgi121
MLVVGARAKVDDVSRVLLSARSVEKRHGCDIALVRASVVYGREHVEAAVRHAIRAFDTKTNASDSLAGEILCYVVAERQVHAAIKKAGLSRGDSEVVVAAAGRDPKGAVDELLREMGWIVDESVVSGPGKELASILKTMKVDVPVGYEGRELELILEKVALLDIMK